MKIRNGYVSNSSSSSFVIAGYLVEDENRERFFSLAKKAFPEMKKYLSIDEMINHEGYDIKNDFTGMIVKTGCGDNGFEKGKTFVGRNISISDDDNCGMNDSVVDIDDIQNDLKEFDNMFGDNEKKIKIITGTMYS